MTPASKLQSAPHSRLILAAHANARQLAGAPGLFYSNPAVLVLTSRRGGPVAQTPDVPPSRICRSLATTYSKVTLPVTSDGGAHEVAIASETSDAVHNEWTIAAGASPNVPAALKGR